MAKLITGSKNVALASTPERLVPVATSLSVKALTIVARPTNAGKVYVGNDSVSDTNAPGLDPESGLTITATEPFNAHDVYVCVAVSGDGVTYYGLS